MAFSIRDICSDAKAIRGLWWDFHLSPETAQAAAHEEKQAIAEWLKSPWFFPGDPYWKRCKNSRWRGNDRKHHDISYLVDANKRCPIRMWLWAFFPGWKALSPGGALWPDLIYSGSCVSAAVGYELRYVVYLSSYPLVPSHGTLDSRDEGMQEVRWQSSYSLSNRRYECCFGGQSIAHDTVRSSNRCCILWRVWSVK